MTLRALDGEAELRVADRGIGIDEAMHATLFQPFSQADASLGDRRGGLSLGLPPAKSLLELHGGSIEARSGGLNKGAEFIVRLPIAARGAPAARAAVRSPPPSAVSRRVLIVEDNADTGLSLKEAMEHVGHDVRLVRDAEEAIELVLEFEPEVILCDIGLPGLDGYALARRIRALEEVGLVFMVAVTGYAAPEDQQRAAKAGFDRHFRKPPDIDRLCALIDELPARADARDAQSGAA